MHRGTNLYPIAFVDRGGTIERYLIMYAQNFVSTMPLPHDNMLEVGDQQLLGDAP